MFIISKTKHHRIIGPKDEAQIYESKCSTNNIGEKSDGHHHGGHNIGDHEVNPMVEETNDNDVIQNDGINRMIKGH